MSAPGTAVIAEKEAIPAAIPSALEFDAPDDRHHLVVLLAFGRVLRAERLNTIRVADAALGRGIESDHRMALRIAAEAAGKLLPGHCVPFHGSSPTRRTS
jgi:hypothetical protein